MGTRHQVLANDDCTNVPEDKYSGGVGELSHPIGNWEHSSFELAA